MKTRHIALTLLASAALMLSSCVNESEINVGGRTLDNDEVAFRTGVAQVRSSALTDELSTVQLGTVSTPQGAFILEDNIVSLDDAMVTRGTPAFTENVAGLYDGIFSAYCASLGGTAPFKFDKEEDLWSHHYAGMGDLWQEGASYQFFMWMPTDIPGVTSGADGLTKNSDGTIEFDYVTPNQPDSAKTADAQKDILFTSKTIKQNGESIIFYHALTGVKFSNYFDNEGILGADGKTLITTKTVIKSVKLEGLKNSGHCKVTPNDEKKSKDVSIWSNQDGKATFVQTFSENTTDYQGSTYGLDTLLKEKGVIRNLNDAAGSQTFWFVPQDLSRAEGVKDSVAITVVFDVYLNGKKTFTDKKLTVNLSKQLKGDHLIWKAGQLHTFTLKPTAVGVELVDQMDDEKFVKSKVVVENKGNVWEYVRVNIIGNWMGLVCEGEDENGTLKYPEDKLENYVILMGYPSDKKYESGDHMGEYIDQLMVNPWNDKDFDANGNYRTPAAQFVTPYTKYGTFVGLPCMGTSSGPGNTVNNWVRHDKYYYYTKPIGPGDSVTDDLFSSYTVGKSPEFWIADMWGTRRPAKNVHLEMDLAVQAIEAPMKADGKTPAMDYEAAWTAVLNPNNDDSFNFNDL